jgi:ArsR family metal-binding transcriptional regulator
MRLWANGKVIVSAEDETDRDLLIAALGLDPVNPNPDKTLDEIIKILQKAYPNINVNLSNSWHELWEGEVIFAKEKSTGIENCNEIKNIKNRKRGIIAEIEDGVWLLAEP